MVETGIRAALDNRYDGPLPFNAAVPPDWDRPRHEQIANRKRWAWCEVRRLGRRMVVARRAFRASGALAHHHDWARARGSLTHALATWACFRNWLERLEINPEPDIPPKVGGRGRGASIDGQSPIP